MSFSEFTITALIVLKRAILVLAVVIPAILFALVAGVFGSGGGGGFGIVLTLALCGLGWVLLPVFHIGPRTGIFLGILWGAFAVLHVISSVSSTTGAVLVCWVIATLFVAIRLKAKPPHYFPETWKSAVSGQEFNDS